MSAVVTGTASLAGRANGTTHLHLTRRGRVVFTSLAALPLVGLVLVVALNGGMAAAEGASGHSVGAQSTGAQSAQFEAAQFESAQFEYVTIQPGQSLWQLAVELAPTSDPRDTIAEIVSLNRLSSDSVQSGQRLALPLGS